MIIEKKKFKENTRQYIYRVLKNNIMSLHLKPGEAIREIELSNLLGVSRTPLREAIVQLIEEKLLVVFPQKGSFVSKIDLNIVEEAIFIRELCEAKILKLACEVDDNSEFIMELEKNLAYQKAIEDYGKDLYEFFYLDNKFHYTLFKYFNKRNSWKAIRRLSTHYDRLRLLDALERTNLKITLKQHSQIIELIKNRDSSGIEKLIIKHLSNYREVIEEYRKKYPDYFV